MRNKYIFAVYIPTIVGVLLSLPMLILFALSIVTKQPIDVEAGSISSCVAIIGLAVATWVGLSISNTVERRDLENIDRKQQEIDSWIDLQKGINRNLFIDELSKNSMDPIIRGFCTNFLSTPLDASINYLLLTEIEQNISRIVQIHNLGATDADICLAAKNTKNIIDRLAPTKDNTVQAYRNYCNATLEYYLGYHDRDKQSEHFALSIQQYEQYANRVGMKLISSFEEENLEDYVARAKEEQLDERRAYLYNTLGDAYRFTTEIDSSTRAAKYCSYACKFSKNNNYPKNQYLRNLGCALERLQKEKGGLTDASFEIIRQNYIESLKSSRPNYKNFQVILSLLDKQINRKLDIGFDGRKKTAYDSEEFLEKWKAVKAAHGEIDDLLSDMKKYADQAKQLFPQYPVGYQYKGVYYWHKYASIRVDPGTSGDCPVKDADHYRRRAEREKEIVNHLLVDDRVIELV